MSGLTAKPFEPAVPKRTKDPWYPTLIDERRAGDLSDEEYNYLHAYTTLRCGSWLDDTAPPKYLCQQHLDLNEEE